MKSSSQFSLDFFPCFHHWRCEMVSGEKMLFDYFFVYYARVLLIIVSLVSASTSWFHSYAKFPTWLKDARQRTYLIYMQGFIQISTWYAHDTKNKFDLVTSRISNLVFLSIFPFFSEVCAIWTVNPWLRLRFLVPYSMIVTRDRNRREPLDKTFCS